MQHADLSITINETRVRKRLGQIAAETIIKQAGDHVSQMQKSLVSGQRRSTEYLSYVLYVTYGEIKWTVERRYSQFDSLDHWLRLMYPEEMADVKLPARKRIVAPSVEDSQDEERMKLLEDYLKELLAIESLNRCFIFLHFLMLENPKRSPVALHPSKQSLLIKRGDFVDELRARFFVLQEHLYYFKEKLDVTPVGIVLLDKRGIEIDEEVIAGDHGPEKEYSFFVKVPGRKRPYFLKAESKKSRKEWIAALRACTPEEGQAPPAAMSYVPHGVSEFEEVGEDEHPELEASLVEAYRRIFNELDQDGSGAISINELIIALADAGWEFKDDVVKSLMRMVDFDGSGALDVDEFIDLISMLNFLQAAYDIVDEDKSGTIERMELPKVLRDAEFSFENEEQVEALFMLCDRDGSGKIEFEEYLHLVFYLKFLTKLFREFDPEGTGELDKKDLHTFLDKAGLEVAPEVFEKVLDMVDKAKTSSLSFEETCHFVFELEWGNIAQDIEQKLAGELEREKAAIEQRIKIRRKTIASKAESRLTAVAEQKEAVERAREMQRAEKAAAVKQLTAPVDIILYTKSSKPKAGKLWMSDDGTKLYYKDKKSFVQTKEILRISPGRGAEAFKKKVLPEKEGQSFSLLLASASVDLETKDFDAAQNLIQLLSVIIAKEKSAPKVQIADTKTVPTPEMVVVSELDVDTQEKAVAAFQEFALPGTSNSEVINFGPMLDKVSNGSWRWDPDTCRDILKCHNTDDEFTQAQFEDAVRHLQLWVGAFDKKAVDGRLVSMADVAEAFTAAGFGMDVDQADAVVLMVKASSRAASGAAGKKEGVMDLEDFVAACGFLRAVWVLFKKQAGGAETVSRAVFRAILPLVGVTVADDLVKVVTNDLIRHNEEALTFAQVCELVLTVAFAPIV